VLLFDTSNQRLPSSILEDSVNKPWRPLPSKRITPQSTRRFLLALIPVVFFASLYLGGVEETVIMMVLTWMYNDLAGADENYVIRNLINSGGVMSYASGSLKVAAGFGQYDINKRGYIWLGIVGMIVFTTLQMQDLPDMEGDKLRGRRTLPLVHGEFVARLSIATTVVFWSVICPWFWEVSLTGWSISLGMGVLKAGRVLLLTSVEADKVTWKLWCIWMVTLYLLPLTKNLTVFMEL